MPRLQQFPDFIDGSFIDNGSEEVINLAQQQRGRPRGAGSRGRGRGLGKIQGRGHGRGHGREQIFLSEDSLQLMDFESNIEQNIASQDYDSTNKTSETIASGKNIVIVLLTIIN